MDESHAVRLGKAGRNLCMISGHSGGKAIQGPRKQTEEKFGRYRVTKTQGWAKLITAISRAFW